MSRLTLKITYAALGILGLALVALGMTRFDLGKISLAEGAPSAVSDDELRRERAEFMKIPCLSNTTKIGELRGITSQVGLDTIGRVRLDRQDNLYVSGTILDRKGNLGALYKISQSSGAVQNLMEGEPADYVLLDSDVTSQGDAYLLLANRSRSETYVARVSASGERSEITVIEGFLGNFVMADQDGSLWVCGLPKSPLDTIGMTEKWEIRNIGLDGKTISIVVKDIPIEEAIEGLFVRNKGRVNFVSNASGKLYDFDKKSLISASLLPFEKFPAVVRYVITDTVSMADGGTRWAGVMEGRFNKLFRGVLFVTDANGKVTLQKPMPVNRPFIIAFDTQGNLIVRGDDGMAKLEKLSIK